MMTKLLDDGDGLKTCAIVLETGDEAMASLERFARGRSDRAAQRDPGAAAGGDLIPRLKSKA